MSTRRLVDVIVLGGRIGPLSAACLLARRGYKVLHVEHEGLSTTYSDDGLRLPLEPDLVPSPRSSPVISHVLKELALLTDTQRVLRAVSPDLQVLSPGHRFDLSSEASKRSRELSREFGKTEAQLLDKALGNLLRTDEELDPLLAALPPLPPGGFCERRALRKAASGIPLDQPPPAFEDGHPVTGAIEALGKLSTHLYDPSPSPLHSIRAKARFLRGGVFRLDGRDGKTGNAYSTLLRKKLEELGGVSLAKGAAIAEEVVIEGGRIAGLKILSDQADYRCRYLVSGVDTAVLHRLLPLEGRRRRYDAELDRVRPREVLFSANIVLPRQAVPVGLGELAVYVNPDAPDGAEEKVILLETFAAMNEKGSVKSQVVLQASCFMPANRLEARDDYLEGLRDRIMGALQADLLPFLDKTVVMVSSPMLTRRASRGTGLLPHPLFESDIVPAMGVGLLGSRTPYKNLVLASREVLPGLGTEGEFLTGHHAASVVGHLARKHDPLKDQ